MAGRFSGLDGQTQCKFRLIYDKISFPILQKRFIDYSGTFLICFRDFSIRPFKVMSEITSFSRLIPPVESTSSAVDRPYSLPAVCGFVITFLMVFLNSADFEGAAADSFEFKYQIFLRLGVCGLAGTYGLYYIGSAISRFREFPTVFVALYGIIVLSTLFGAIDFKYAGVGAVLLWTLFLFLPAALDRMTNDQFIMALTCGTCAYVIGSWVVYLLFPDIGVWREFTSNDDFIERMGGLGHPNNLGVNSASSILLMLILFRRNKLNGFILLGWAFVWLLTSYFCLSRTSFALTLLGAMIINRESLLRWDSVKLITALGVGGLLGLVYLAGTGALQERIDTAFSSASKSGDADELTSFTGRSDIWKHGAEEISEKPFIGYGYGCQRFVMKEHHYHCHNMVLNACLGSGIFAGFAIISLILYIAYQFVVGQELFVLAFAPMFVLGGLIESMIYSPAPSFEMVAFFSLVLWRKDSLKPNFGQQTEHASDQAVSD